MESPLVKFENFTFKYDAQQNPTLKDINLEVRNGEKIVIVGPSGCGKSTLAHCINGLIPFSYSGEITGSLSVDGKETKDSGVFELSKNVGTVLQDSDGQFVGLTVAEDIAFSLENDCVDDESLHSRVLAAAKRVGIDGHLSHAPSDLSGGQKQRVSIAGVMIDNVKLFLFDEPLANLDPATGKNAIELIDEIQKETGAAVIIIEHRLEDTLWRHADRVVLMSDGCIVSDTTPDELLSSDLLAEHGVREPLYITALKYSGVNITPDMHPWNVGCISLTETQTDSVKRWYQSSVKKAVKDSSEILLEAKGLDFCYANGCHALNDVTISLNKGEITAVVGTNGAGKSTFSKLICGFENQQSGSIFFNGEDLSQYSIKERADRIGYVMQNPNQMISKVMIMDEVSLGLVSRNTSEDEIKIRTEQALKVCGLWQFRNWPVSALSYGQKKRLTIASILTLNPEMIILDEPTSGQDYRHYTEIMEFLTGLNRSGITIMLITHDMHLMLEYADRTIVFNSGKVIADSTGADILTSPDIIAKASLKETSLYDLAGRCGIEDSRGFVQHFIDFERGLKADG